jgi:glutathione S-transferase fosA5
MARGINHITLAVRDIEASFLFYTEVLGLQPVARWYKGAYLDAVGDWVCLSLDDAARSGSLPDYTHVAFTAAQTDFPGMVERLRRI